MTGREKVRRDVLFMQAETRPGPHGKKEWDVMIQRVQVWKRTSRYIFSQKRYRGSLTVEAALICPLIGYALSGFLYFLLIFRLQEDVAQALSEAGREIGQYAYSSQDEDENGLWTVTLLGVKQKLQSRCQDQAALRLVEGGAAGIHLWKSSILKEDATILLVAEYELKTPWVLLGIDTIPVVQKQACRAWVGFTGENSGEERVVYITPHGQVYHSSLDCRYLALSIQSVPAGVITEKRNQDGEVYRKCENCYLNESEGLADEEVYITNYGNRYHRSLECIALKRSVQMVFLSETQGKKPCEGCAAEE